MELGSALPSINGKPAEHLGGQKCEMPDTRPTSSAATGGRRALGILPKSAGATSATRHARHSEVMTTSSWHSYGDQAQRRSSMHSPSRMVVRVFTSRTAANTRVEDDSNAKQQQHEDYTKELDGSYQDPIYDSRDEVQQLRDENATFRRENGLLRTKLVEKMRGQSKVVAGGQFRAASASNSSPKVPIAPSVVCTKCTLARAKAAKAHRESEQAQTATMELRKYVDKIEAEQNRLWEDQREHLSEIAQLRERLAEKVEECLLIETECTKLDKQVKSLQPENDIDRIFVEQAEVENIMVDKESQCTLQQSSDDEIKASQLREIASLRSEVQVLAQQLNAREQELQLVSTDLGVVQATIKQERAQREQVTKVWLDEVSAFKKRVLELEQALESSKVFSNDHQVAYQKELRLIKVVNQQLRSELATRENAVQVLEQQHKEDQLKREQQQQTLVQALKARIEQKVADVDRLHALVSEHAAEKISYNAVRRQVEDLEHQVDILMKEKDRLITDNLLLQQEAEAKAQTQHDKLQDVENRRLSKALSVAEQDRQLLQTQLSEVEAELADQILILQRQKRSHAKAMERLFESSLRLCVVAPTVNVQLNTNGAFLKSKGSNLSSAAVNQDKEPTEGMSILCRSSPQHDSIKRVIESDVLPQFTSVFLQGNDDASPQSGVPMARWLQDLLIDMQSRIAAQLEGIYSAAAANDSK